MNLIGSEIQYTAPLIGAAVGGYISDGKFWAMAVGGIVGTAVGQVALCRIYYPSQPLFSCLTNGASPNRLNSKNK